MLRHVRIVLDKGRRDVVGRGAGAAAGDGRDVLDVQAVGGRVAHALVRQGLALDAVVDQVHDAVEHLLLGLHVVKSLDDRVVGRAVDGVVQVPGLKGGLLAAGEVLAVDGLDGGGGPGIRKAGQGHVAVFRDGFQLVGAGAVHVQAHVLIGVGEDRLAVGRIDDAHALDVGHQVLEARARTRAGEGEGQVRVVRDGNLHRADQRRAQGRVCAAGEGVGHVLRHERVAGVELDAAAERDVHAAVLVLHIGLGQRADDVAVVVQVEQGIIQVDDDVVLDLL